MPELPEVETVMRGMQPALEGKKLINIELFKIKRIYISYEFNWTVLNFNAFIRR